MKREDGCVYCESVEQATPKSPRTEAKYQSQLKELEAECAILRGNYKQAINDIEKIILTGTVDYVELNKQLHEYIRYVATYPDNIGQALLDRLAKAETVVTVARDVCEELMGHGFFAIATLQKALDDMEGGEQIEGLAK